MEELTGQEMVKMLLELPPIVTEDGRRDIVTKESIRVATQTASSDNVLAWLKSKYDPKPEHRARLYQFLLQERAKRQSATNQNPEIAFKSH